MSQIAETPEPPYYAVIAPAVLSDDVTGYPELGARLVELAKDIDGFLGIETCYQRGFAIAISYWRSLEAIDRWRQHGQHLRAKDLGKTKWFDQYVTRIAKVERAY
jgi:heme-degrading monooxygenase HmoA